MVKINKRGQDLSIGTLILIVLGVIVLVLLILGFSIGWSNLWEKINIFGGGSSIGDVATACSLAATSNNKFDYCENFRKIKVDGNTEYVNCQDPRINLDTEIPCSDKDYALEKCEKFATESVAGKSDPQERLKACSELDTKVNNNLCSSRLATANFCATLSSDKTCKGNAVKCNTITNAQDCSTQKLCIWNGQTNTCSGTTTTCDKIPTEIECARQKSCSWS
jgi:hypothetical protein